eukprot:Colp12_sorted_trinity150504_noHs@35580
MSMCVLKLTHALLSINPHSYTSGTFSPIYTATIAFNYEMRVTTVGSQRFKLQLWDLAGSERYELVTEEHLGFNQAFVVVYDATDHASFLAVENYVRRAAEKNGGSIRGVLVANKVDAGRARAVEAQDGQALAQRLGLSYAEASALSGEGVPAVFETAIAIAEQARNIPA